MTAPPDPRGGGLLLAFYGDDFTGSTDAMEALTLSGLPTVLFLRPPSDEELGRFAGYRAVGLAGVSRSKSPAWMDENLPGLFGALKRLGAPLFHYKVCSTFDSAPHVGSIGRAIDIGQGVFASPFVPMVVGAPALRRYVLFGNLFATVQGVTHRLDRHPTMAHHPVTPMGEADLRLHLCQQTAKGIGLVDVLALRSGEADRRLDEAVADGAEVVLFDTLDEASLAEAGRLIWSRCGGEAPVFSASSSGLEYALVAHWRAAGLLPEPVPLPAPGEAERVVAACGSCSPATAGQIEWALEHGFADVALDARRLVTPEPAAAEAETERAVERALAALGAGRSVVLYSARGPADPSIGAFRAHLERAGMERSEGTERLGHALGRILRAVLLRSGVRRAVVAGGDTSGQCGAELGLYALTVLAPTAPGSPLCRGAAEDPALDGLEIALKGGQVGGPDYFEVVRRGCAAAVA
ncbi:MAG TPA: four-carbon acid sugar kinase family protein [Geminicoccaceae bacterium]|nr:four-carbon acid sugar kinase family protein [Geminicoccaceae bacterium]